MVTKRNVGDQLIHTTFAPILLAALLAAFCLRRLAVAMSALSQSEEILIWVLAILIALGPCTTLTHTRSPRRPRSVTQIAPRSTPSLCSHANVGRTMVRSSSGLLDPLHRGAQAVQPQAAGGEEERLARPGRPGMDGFWSRELLGSWGTEDNLFTAFALVVAFGASLTPAADVFPVAFPAVQSGRS